MHQGRKDDNFAAVNTHLVVCNVLQNNKDYFDQSLDEIKLLKYINEADPDDEFGMLRLFDYFYYKVCLTFAAIRMCCDCTQ